MLDRIVSISLPYIRPIVRGTPAAAVEFGAKLDLSIDGNGIARSETLSFGAYNKSYVLIGAIERYCERMGHYPERALADKSNRNRVYGYIRISFSSLFRVFDALRVSMIESIEYTPLTAGYASL